MQSGHTQPDQSNQHGRIPDVVAGKNTAYSKRRSALYLGIVVVVAVLTGLGIWWFAMQTIDQSIQVAESPQPIIPTKSTTTPQVASTVVLENREHIWEIAFLPTKQMIFSERKGTISIVEDGVARVLSTISDVRANGEGGLLGMAVDPDFTNNRYLFTCYNSTTGPDIRVVRWEVKADLSGLEGRKDIITGIRTNSSGRHSGCRVAVGPDGYVWVGTGDAAAGGLTPQTPQDPASLNGKVLRVDRDGNAAPGNLGGAFDSRIYNYGHRNIQGLAFFPVAHGDVLGVTVEHGSSVDDEVNMLKPGNFGWDPDKNYTEANIPMTDKIKYPDAIDAVWSSGNPTEAPSGATFLNGSQWKAWDDALAVGFLKDKKLVIMLIGKDNKLIKEEVLFQGKFGRIRAVALGPDGNLYVGTSNGSADQIIRITPY